MDPTRRTQLIKLHTVAKASLTRMQIFIEASELKGNEIKVELDKLPSTLSKYESSQDELECLDEANYSLDRDEFENQYCHVEEKFNDLLHPVVDPPLSKHSSPRTSRSGHSNNFSQSHASSTHIMLPVNALPTFDGDTCSWLHFRDMFVAFIVHNTALSNIQKFHYLIASLNNESKDLINNLQIKNENFLVAWQLVSQRYNNERLIAKMRAKHLCQKPQVKKEDTSSLRQLINHVSSHINALQALSFNVPIQELMLNHLMLATLEVETQ